MSSAHLAKFESVKPADIEWRNDLPYSREFDDIYFSSSDGLAESTYVFIEGNQLESDWAASDQNQFIIAELGFGSGLNFLITAELWQKQSQRNPTTTKQQLHYVSIEKRPLTQDDFERASKHWPQFSNISNKLLQYYPSLTYGRHQIQFDSLNITLTLIYMPADEALDSLIAESQSQENKIAIDHWFLDGFAPAKNKSMWGESLCDKIAQLSKAGTRLATFSVASIVKKPLIEVGFKIQKRKGFGKKREMLTATMETPVSCNSAAKFINIKFEQPWFNYQKTSNANRVAIIGSGIAGCATAYTLAQKGFSVDIFESGPTVAPQASSAAAGIFHPQLTSDVNYNSQFNWLSYLFLLRFLSDLTQKETDRIILSQGVVRLLQTQNHQKHLLQLAEDLLLQKWIKPSTDIASSRAIFYPHSAAVDMTAFCQILLDRIPSNKLNIFLAQEVHSIRRIQELWELESKGGTEYYNHVVYCGGANSRLSSSFGLTDTHVTRGQTCLISAEELKTRFAHTLCEKIYLVPRKKGQFHLGTTFDNFIDDKLNLSSQLVMLKNLNKLLTELGTPPLNQQQIESIPLQGTLGYRLHAQDRMPIIGGVVDLDKLQNTFNGLGQKRLLRQSMSFYNQSGLWLNTAYGSHGLIYSLLGSKHLAALISNDISPISASLANSLHPARFAIKDLRIKATET